MNAFCAGFSLAVAIASALDGHMGVAAFNAFAFAGNAVIVMARRGAVE